jgi:hypothetical protein
VPFSDCSPIADTLRQRADTRFNRTGPFIP